MSVMKNNVCPYLGGYKQDSNIEYIFYVSASFLQVCKRKDPKLNDCIKSSIYALQPYLGKGIPEMKIQSMDPLSVTQLDLSAAIGEFKFKDLKFGLVNQFNLGEVVLDLDKCYAYMDVHHPIMIVKGVYDIRGKILAIQLEGQGPFDMNASKYKRSIECTKN